MKFLPFLTGSGSSMYVSIKSFQLLDDSFSVELRERERGGGEEGEAGYFVSLICLYEAVGGGKERNKEKKRKKMK